MSTDDKFGIGAGLLALGLAAGVILLGQLTYEKDLQVQLDKPAAAPADSAKAPQPENSGQIAKPSLFYKIIPHRELNVTEAWFDGIVCVLALPAGICFFAMGMMSGSGEKEKDE
jgi:hypothetical protein